MPQIVLLFGVMEMATWIWCWEFVRSFQIARTTMSRNIQVWSNS